jgi:hypothetical protein
MIDFFGFDFVGILILLCILIYLLFDLIEKMCLYQLRISTMSSTSEKPYKNITYNYQHPSGSEIHSRLNPEIWQDEEFCVWAKGIWEDNKDSQQNKVINW